MSSDDAAQEHMEPGPIAWVGGGKPLRASGFRLLRPSDGESNKQVQGKLSRNWVLLRIYLY